MKQFTWSGKLKIIVVDDIKREKILKKHPSLDLNENNKRYPTNIRVTYNKSQKKFLVTFKIGNEVLEGEFKRWAEPWLGPSKLWLDISFNETKSKTKLCIKGDKDKKLFQFFRYDYEKMIHKKGGDAHPHRLRGQTARKTRKTPKARKTPGGLRHCVSIKDSCEYHLKCRDNKTGKWEYMKYKERYKPKHCKKGGGLTAEEKQISKDYFKCQEKKGKSPWQKKYKRPVFNSSNEEENWKKIDQSRREFKKTHKKELDAFDIKKQEGS